MGRERGGLGLAAAAPSPKRDGHASEAAGRVRRGSSTGSANLGGYCQSRSCGWNERDVSLPLVRVGSVVDSNAAGGWAGPACAGVISTAWIVVDRTS